MKGITGAICLVLGLVLLVGGVFGALQAMDSGPVAGGTARLSWIWIACGVVLAAAGALLTWGSKQRRHAFYNDR